jgi:hypothetical protein
MSTSREPKARTCAARASALAAARPGTVTTRTLIKHDGETAIAPTHV